jgi:peptide/nickel transport system permease protein
MTAATILSREARTPLLRPLFRIAGLAGLGLFALGVALSDVVARAPAGATHLARALQPPMTGFSFGTDAAGRDVFSETIHALAVSVPQAVLAASIAIMLGAIAGFGAVRLPMRSGTLLRGIVGIFGAVPVLLLAVAFAAIAGNHFAAIAAGLAAAPSSFVRSFDRAAASADSRHAEFARATGIPGTTLLRRDLVYEIRGHFVSVAARALALVTIVLATMSFLGFGATAPRRDLGAMIADARLDYLHAWWIAAFPALTLMLFILCARLAAALDEGEAP